MSLGLAICSHSFDFNSRTFLFCLRRIQPIIINTFVVVVYVLSFLFVWMDLFFVSFVFVCTNS